MKLKIFSYIYVYIPSYLCRFLVLTFDSVVFVTWDWILALVAWKKLLCESFIIRKLTGLFENVYLDLE